MIIKLVGIDLAKHNFQVCVLTEENKIHSNKKVTDRVFICRSSIS